MRRLRFRRARRRAALDADDRHGRSRKLRNGRRGQCVQKICGDKTNGAIQVVCIYGGSPGDDEGERFRKVQKGTLDMALGGIANIVPLEKKLGLLTLPYLFANLNEVVAGTNGAPAELLNKYATEAGFRILTWTYTGFRFISNDKHPITKLSDMKGLKFRVLKARS